jgi:pilus assembly protein CpaE
MLTAGIASGDKSGSAQLLAGLQQTGMVTSVKEWAIPAEQLPDADEAVPDIVLLDLGREAEPYFAFGAHLRRIQPMVRLVACSAGPAPNQQLLLEAMRSGVQDFVSKPVSPEALREILIRLQLDVQPLGRHGGEKLIVVMGSKGGVGATTVAVNLGVDLCAVAHKRTVLLDLARPLGNAHLFLNLRPRFGIRDAFENLDRLDTHLLGGLLTHHQSKLELLAGTLHPEGWRNISVTPILRVVNVAQAGFDLAVLDMGPQFSPEWNAVLQTARMILVVAEANVPSLWNLERRIQALAASGIEPERIRIIVNRWHKGDEQTLKSIEDEIKLPVFACLPNDFDGASTSTNHGTPLNGSHSSALGARYRELASRLVGIETATPPAKRTSLGGIFAFGGKR